MTAHHQRAIETADLLTAFIAAIVGVFADSSLALKFSRPISPLRWLLCCCINW